MKCDNCGKENPDEALFCQECGNSIVENAKMDYEVEKEVDRRLNEKEIKHILSQVKKLALILGFVGILVIIIGFLAVIGSSSAYYIFIGFLGVLYLALAIIIFTQKNMSIVLITGILTLILGFITGLLPILIGISLIYYYNKFSKLVKKS